MHLPRWRINLRPPVTFKKPAEAGFSLLEVLMGAVLLAISLGMAGTMNGVATRGINSSTALNDRNAAVDANIAMIRSLAERYTWCSGAPDFEARKVDPDTCLATSPSDESYFSPAVSQDDVLQSPQIGNDNRAQFEAACQDGTLNNGLIDQINALPKLTGIERTASAVRVDNLPTHRIQILYETPASDNDSVVRSLVITPPVASFCS